MDGCVCMCSRLLLESWLVQISWLLPASWLCLLAHSSANQQGDVNGHCYTEYMSCKALAADWSDLIINLYA